MQQTVRAIQGLLFSEEELKQCAPPEEKKPEIVTADYHRLKYYDFPKNDNEQLFNFQYEYIRNKDDKAYWKLWQLTAVVAERLIIKEQAKKGFILTPDDLEEKKSDTCEYLLRRYKTRNKYCIYKNYIAAIKDSVRHALYYRTEIEKLTVSINDLKEFKK